VPTVVPHRVLVAPSGFKESLAADQVAEAIAAGVRRSLPGAVVDTVPMMAGGEGSASALARATGGEMMPMTVTGPVGQPVAAGFAVLGGAAAGTAVVEMAAAAGLRLVPRELRDPGATTTYGVGELLQVALETGCRRIIVGCGHSGTDDGGAGAVEALGAGVLDAAGQPVGRAGCGAAAPFRGLPRWGPRRRGGRRPGAVAGGCRPRCHRGGCRRLPDPEGQGAAEIARRAKELGKPVLALVGSIGAVLQPARG